LNLDQILRLKDLQNQNISCEEAIKKI
jgi:hypothetical protein